MWGEGPEQGERAVPEALLVGVIAAVPPSPWPRRPAGPDTGQHA